MGINKLMKNLKNKQFKVVAISNDNGSFTLDNGDTYPIPFELDYTPTIDEFQKILNDSKSLMLNLLDKIAN